MKLRVIKHITIKLISNYQFVLVGNRDKLAFKKEKKNRVKTL
jgi:hypothetical protein